MLNEPVLVDLVASLGSGANLIYPYVHDNIETLPIFNSLKGPLGTVLDGKGTVVDQAELLALMLRQASYNTRNNPGGSMIGNDAVVELGTATMNADELFNWLGVGYNAQTHTVDAAATRAILNAGNFQQVTVANDNSSVTLLWAYVKVTYQGTVVYLDPARKTYLRSPGLGKTVLLNDMNYSVGDFTGPVEASATTTAWPRATVKNLDGTAAKNKLASYAANFVTALRANQSLAASSTRDIIGGKTVQQLSPATPFSPLTQSPDMAPYSDYDPTVPSGSLPRSLLLFQMTSVAGIGTPPTPYVAFNSSDLYGHSLYVSFGGNLAPNLYIDGTLLGVLTTSQSNSVTSASDLVCYPAGPGATGADWPGPNAGVASARLYFRYVVAGQTIAISNTWGAVGRGMVERQRRLLAIARNATPNAPPGSEPVWRSLSMLGFTWANQAARVQEVVDQAASTLTALYGNLGLVGLAPLATNEWSPSFDIGYKGINVQSLATTTPQPNMVPVEIAVTTIDNEMVSTLESTVLEQTHPGLQAASMAKLLAQSAQPYDATTNPNGSTVYEFNNNPTQDSNEASVQQTYYNNNIGQFSSTYSSFDLHLISCWANPADTSCSSYRNYRVILPLRGNFSVGSGIYPWPAAGESGSAYWPFGQSSQAVSGYGGAGLGTYLSSYRDAGIGGTPVSTSVSGTGNTAAADPGAGLQTSAVPGAGTTGAGLVPGALAPVKFGLNQNVVLTGNASPLDPSQVVLGGGTSGASFGQQAGNFVYSSADLSVGSGGYPFDLSLVTSYDSNHFLQGGPLGRGWTHNFVETAMVDSDTMEALGINSPISGAAGIVALYVGLDLLQSGVTIQPPHTTTSAVESPLQRILEACLVTSWFEDQVTSSGARTDGLPLGNVVTVSGNGSTERFVRLPSGGTNSYNPPPGSSATLTVQPGATQTAAPGGFTYTTKTQRVMTFGNLGRLVSWADPAGASVNLSYANGQLSKISNSVGRSLTFLYTTINNNYVLGSVTDDSQRTAQYGYDATGTLLTSYTDPNGKIYQYGYEASGSGRLTTVTYPATPANPSTPRITNTYDKMGLGMLTGQQDAVGNQALLYFAGSRTQVDRYGPGVVSAGTSSLDNYQRYFDLRGNQTYFMDGIIPVLINGVLSENLTSLERISKRGQPADAGGQANERFSAREPSLTVRPAFTADLG